MVYYNPKVMSPYNKQIMDRIDEIYTDNPDYGYLYIYHQLLEEGYTMGRDRTLKYMNLMGLQAIFPKKKKNVSLQDKSHKIYPYLLEHYWKSSNGSKSVDVPNANEFWSGDITYIRTINGFMYMAAIIDWHSKAILGYKLSNCIDATLVTTILQEALDKYLPPLIFNSDQGSQYTGSEHTSLLKNYGVQISMNGKGRSIDNIPIESFFRTLKYNCIFINEFNNIFELKEVIKSYVDKYNNEKDPDILLYITLFIEKFYNELCLVNKSNQLIYFNNLRKILVQLNDLKRFNLMELSDENIQKAGLELPISRLVINQASSLSAGGSLTNGFAPTTTLGCGSWGGNSISENLDYKHLMNVSRIGKIIPDKEVPTDDEIWA